MLHDFSVTTNQKASHCLHGGSDWPVPDHQSESLTLPADGSDWLLCLTTNQKALHSHKKSNRNSISKLSEIHCFSSGPFLGSDLTFQMVRSGFLLIWKKEHFLENC